MNVLYSGLARIAGLVLVLTGVCMFIYGLASFAASKGQSLQGFGAVLLGYGSLILGIYVNPRFRQGTEDAVDALRRIADRFFDF